VPRLRVMPTPCLNAVKDGAVINTEFTSFLKSYIAIWAGRSGVL
jgi:hypothetical protein